MNITIKKITPTELQSLLAQKKSNITYMHTAAGILKISTVDDCVYQTEFLSATEEQKIDAATTNSFLPKKMLLVGTPFQQLVWQAALTIPAGKKASYTDVARMINAPKAVRAVANALGDNKIAYFIPCHRVVRKTGNLCGYFWGIDKKEALLKNEGAL